MLENVFVITGVSSDYLEAKNRSRFTCAKQLSIILFVFYAKANPYDCFCKPLLCCIEKEISLKPYLSHFIAIKRNKRHTFINF